MQYVVIETGGKQYKINEGSVFEIEKLETEPGKTIFFEKVLLYVSDNKVLIGKPYLENISVSAKVLDHTKGQKIEVVRFKAKSKYRRKTGHRQLLSKVSVEKIEEKEGKKEEVKTVKKTS